MTLAKKTAILATTGIIACLSYAPTSMADSSKKHYSQNSSSYSSKYSNRSFSSIPQSIPLHYITPKKLKERPSGVYGAWKTARYYKIGIKQFEKNNLDKAEKAFKSVLRMRLEALDKEAYGFLAIINEKQGDIPQAEKYAEAYFALKDSPS